MPKSIHGVKRGFVILIVGSAMVIFGFSFFAWYVSELFDRMDSQVMQPMGGLDYAVFVMRPSGFTIGMIGITIQVAGGTVLFVDRRRK